MSDDENGREVLPVIQTLDSLATKRSRKYVTARTARRWLMDDLQCTDCDAESALWKRMAACFPVSFESLRVTHVDDEGDASESRSGACRHPYDGGRTSAGLLWLAEKAQGRPHGAGTRLSWETGDFCLRRDDLFDDVLPDPWIEGQFIEVKILGLCFKRSKLIESFSLSAFSCEMHESQLESRSARSVEGRSGKGEGRGRPLAEWWPDFVAELTAYVSEGLLPKGIGHQGQGEVFAEVAKRLAERDKLPPDRTQTQEAINAVLRRMRSAGN